ncbi:MAG: pyridoxamine 5'-phosphate oxidase family protein [Pseudonocardiaceae bacterium]
MPNERALLEQYVRAGKLMQLASLNSDGSPVVCNVWYDAHFTPDVLRFISRHSRQHSQNIRRDVRVAGGIIAVSLEGLGQAVRGVTFTGVARELPTCGTDREVAAFVARWPRAEAALRPEKLAHDETANRLYEVTVAGWVLFDEANFPEQPRRVVGGIIGVSAGPPREPVAGPGASATGAPPSPELSDRLRHQ